MINSLSFHLQRVEWQLYVTLTFGANWSGTKTRNKIERIFAWLRHIVEFHTGKRDLSRVWFVASEEAGEMNDRYHVHLLVGNLPKTPNRGDCFSMQWEWKESFRGGFAKIRPYKPSLRGVAYVLKTLDLVDLRAVSSESARDKAQTLAGSHVGKPTTYAGANAYEVGKIGQSFEKGLTVTLSLGLQELLETGANSRRSSARSRKFFERRSKRDAPRTLPKKPSSLGTSSPGQAVDTNRA